jgi:hypothetical protein
MQVLYGEGVACHTGPVPCVDDREVGGEALVRGDVGWVLSRENALLGADPLGKRGRRNGNGRNGEPDCRPDVVTDPMHASTLLARKPGDLPAALLRWRKGRIGKAKAASR